MEKYSDDEGLFGQRLSGQTHTDEQDKVLDHFLHQHLLKLADMNHKDSVICDCCNEKILGRSYCCPSCEFYLHELCANIPVEICHFIHSCPLTLNISYSRKCEACGEGCRGFFYYCGRCSWGIHYACTLKQFACTSTNPEPQEQIEAPLHRHPLSIVEKMREDDGFLCEVCEEVCFGRIYYECSVCNFYVHKSCVEIPRQLYSVYHNCRYFLVLLVCGYYKCGACMREAFGVSYACIECHFKLHLKCALRFEGKTKGLQLEHICHSTGALQKKTDCLGCKFPLEKPCSENLLEVQTPLHPEHTLFLCKTTKRRRCNVCLGHRFTGLFFCCDKCDFNCDSECIYLMPTVQFTNHDSHLLTVVDKVYGKARCNACEGIIFRTTAFRCLKCEFSLHLLCGPLPHTIKYDHMHPLTLEDYVIDDKYEQYCHFCEEKRDPLLPVYHCKRCPYTAELKCVMSEVIACLRGELKEHTVLRCLNRPLTKKNKVIIKGGAIEKLKLDEVEQNNATNKDLYEEALEIKPSLFIPNIFDYFKDDEQNKFRDTIQRMVEELSWVTRRDYSKKKSFSINTDERSEESFDNSLYSEKAFTQLVEKLDSSIHSRKKIKLVLLDPEMQFVKYGKYITRRVFIPILKELMDGKHGDISSETMLDPTIKSICYMYLSELIYSMQTTKVLKIDEDILQTWWNRTKMLQLVGFKVDFIQHHLMLVARCYFGRKARKFANKTSKNQVSEIERLKKEIKALTARVEELEMGHRDHLEYVESATTPFMVKCFSDNEAMQWRPAAYGLL